MFVLRYSPSVAMYGKYGVAGLIPIRKIAQVCIIDARLCNYSVMKVTRGGSLNPYTVGFDPTAHT
jgi:hypothetical protein